MYAFGVLMYVMCVGNLPYAGVPVEQVVTGVANGSLRPSWPDSPPTIEQGLAPQVRSERVCLFVCVFVRGQACCLDHSQQEVSRWLAGQTFFKFMASV